jgi:hypothetical protein
MFEVFFEWYQSGSAWINSESFSKMKRNNRRKGGRREVGMYPGVISGK